MAYTYDDFLSAANSSGLLGEFSQYDLDTAKKHPEFGLSILSLKQDWRTATTDEQRLLLKEAANALRSSYGNYTSGDDGSQYYSDGKIAGQIDSVLDQMNGYGSFSYDTAAPVYDNQYAKQQQELLDSILSREDFSWSRETDPLYSTYKKQYLREGERATANALAQASAASGGRSSSYAVNAANQAGDYYAAQLNDIIPTLYQQAYDRYLNEYSMKLQDLGAVNTQEQMDYAKYLDSLAQYNTDRNLAYTQYLDEYSRLQSTLAALQSQDAVDYGRYLDGLNLEMQREQTAYDQAWDEDARAYERQQSQQAIEQAQIDAILAAGGVPSAALVGSSGYTNEYVQALAEAYQAQLAAQAAAGAGGSSAGSGSSGRANAGSAESSHSSGGDGAGSAVVAFNGGDHSDEIIKALLDDGYTQSEIEAAGYTGDYFNSGSGWQGYSTERNAEGVKASEWEYVRQNIVQNLRAGNFDAVTRYMDQIAAGLSEAQWEEVQGLLKQYGY